MAFFENEGFCPSCSSFSDYPVERRNSFSAAIIKILNGRQQLMVYAPERKSWFDEYPSVVDAMFGGDGSLGIQLATMLAHVVPKPGQEQDGVIRPIRIVDCMSPADLGSDVYYDPTRHTDCNWSFLIDGKVSFEHPVYENDYCNIIHDSRYAIVLIDSRDDSAFEVRILRIPAKK